ncbi:diguanylate cyclase domain-containing protein [Streptomyces sp. AGS-58]|uniref:diguanylate cyclase domain-containing protein n=1 Tax=unclassified Streptomyces TaxID=2593676 RepID=UPI0035A2EE5B
MDGEGDVGLDVMVPCPHDDECDGYALVPAYSVTCLFRALNGDLDDDEDIVCTVHGPDNGDDQDDDPDGRADLEEQAPRAAAGRLGGDEFAVVLELPAGRREQRLTQLVRMLHTLVTLDDGRTLKVAASVGAAAPDVLGTRDLTSLQRAADTALYDGKHSGRAVLATAAHTTVPSINGRRAGRPGTAVWGRAA